MYTGTSLNKPPFKLFLLVFALSVPFWILGAIAGDSIKIPLIELPIAALMTFCPLVAATIFVYKDQKVSGVKCLLKLTVDFEKIKDKKWYVPVVLLMPIMTMISYWYIRMTGAMPPEPKTSLLYVFLFFCMYFVGAIGEEVGWSGYAIEPLQNRYGALKASIILGSVWAAWHIIPFNQAHQTPIWIVWQCISTVLLRIIMVWIFNNTGKSVFAMILFHTMINISPYLLPDNGAHYNPFIISILLMLISVIVIFLWGPKTLARYRYAKSNS